MSLLLDYKVFGGYSAKHYNLRSLLKNWNGVTKFELVLLHNEFIKNLLILRREDANGSNENKEGHV